MYQGEKSSVRAYVALAGRFAFTILSGFSAFIKTTNKLNFKMFRLYRSVKTARPLPSRRHVYGTTRPPPARPSAWHVVLPVALGAAASSYALFALNSSSRMDNKTIFARWNFPNVQWKYSPKLSSGEPLDVLVADWASTTIIEAMDVQAAVMKLMFAWIDAPKNDAPKNDADQNDTDQNDDDNDADQNDEADLGPSGLKALEMITALAACQLAKRDFSYMEIAKMMHPNHENLSKYIAETEQKLWDSIRSMNPVGDASRASEEVKIACVAAIIVQAIQAMCDIRTLLDFYPADTPEKKEREEEVLMASAYWTMTTPADRIIALNMMGVANALIDNTEVWEEAKELGYFPSRSEDLRFVEVYMDLVRVLIKLTRKEVQRETAEIITK